MRSRGTNSRSHRGHRRGQGGTPNRGRIDNHPVGSANDSVKKSAPQKQTKAFPPPKSGLSLENTLSVSRSGGLVKDGDTLVKHPAQEEYFRLIEGKLREYETRYPDPFSEESTKVEIQQNILIYLRRLREGLLSSRRVDQFALQVHTQSFYLAVLFRSSTQVIPARSGLMKLIDHLFINGARGVKEDMKSKIAVLINLVLLHGLLERFPSQMPFYTLQKGLPAILIEKQLDSPLYKWLTSVRHAMNCRNYTRFESLTQSSSIPSLFSTRSDSDSLTDEIHSSDSVLSFLVQSLREKMRDVAWRTLRFSYRQFTVRTSADSDAWLSRSLCLHSVSDSFLQMTETQWMRERAKEGEVQAVQGGVWTIIKRFP